MGREWSIKKAVALFAVLHKKPINDNKRLDQRVISDIQNFAIQHIMLKVIHKLPL